MAIPSTDQILAVLSKNTAVPDHSTIAANLPQPQMQQTMGDKTFADFPAPDPAGIPAAVKEGIKRIALFDPQGHVVPKKVTQRFLPNTQIKAGKPNLAQQVVSVLPQTLRKPVESVVGDLHDALFGNPRDRAVLAQYEADGVSVPLPALLSTEGFLSFIGRSKTDQIEHRSKKLEDAGVPADRAAALAFYDVFSQGNPTDKNVAAAKKMLTALTPSPQEGHVLSLANLGQAAGTLGDVANFFPIGSIEEKGLTRAIQLAQTGERSSVVPTIFSHLVNAGIDRTLAEEYATKFASADLGTIKTGIESLNKAVSTSKVGEALTEDGARAYVKNNFESLKPAYQDIIKKQYAGADNVVSGDAAKHILPAYTGELAPIYHEASSDFAKQLYKEMLDTKQGTRNNTVLFTAGATGVGKTTALRAIGKKLSDFPIVYDTNLTGSSALSKIQDALDRGYQVVINVTHRDPMDSFVNGVLPRVKKENRIISAAEHVARHAQYENTGNGAPAINAIEKKFGGHIEDGYLYIEHIDNSHGRDAARLAAVDNLPKFDYTNLHERLIKATSEAVAKGQISAAHEAAILGKTDSLAARGGIESGNAKGEEVVGKKQIIDKIPRPPTLTETAARNTNLVRSISEEKMTGPVRDLLEPHFPHLTDKTLTAFSKRLAQLSRASDIEGVLSAMQRLQNQGAETAQRVLDATMPISVRSALSPRQAQLTVDQLTREIKTPENAAIAESEYSHLWEVADQRVVDRFNEANIEAGILEDVMHDHPGKAFTKFRLPGQSYTDLSLDEALVKGMKTGGKNKSIDTYLSENGYRDMSEAQQGLEDFLSIRQQLLDVKNEIRELRPKVRSAQIVRGILDEVPVVPNARIGAIDELANTADLRGTYRDISGFAGGFRDMYRNFERFFGSRFPEIKKAVLDPFDAAKGKYVDEYNKLGDQIGKNIIEKYGIKRGSKESQAIMDYGEAKNGARVDENAKYVTKDLLVEHFGQDRANDIMAAADWFKNEYDRLIGEVNTVRKQIYPNNPSKLIPYRKDYFRHYQEIGGSIMDAVRNFMDVPSGIDPKLVGISEFTKPKSKFLSFAQKRLGLTSERDAVGGFLDYAQAFSYAKHIDPQIGMFRYLRRKLADKAPLAGSTEGDVKMGGIDNFLQFLDDFSNNLATKTNPVDRWIQKRIPGGRATIKTIDWANNRIKANTILGNLGSAVSQVANIPQGLASAKQYSIPGIKRTLASIFEKNTAAAESTFLKERYLVNLKDRFPRDFWSRPVKAGTEATARTAADILKVFDQVGTHFIWNSHYAKAVALKMEDPVKYADDFTRKLVAGRGIGELPVDQQAKITQMIAPFTVEVQNLWWVMQDHVTARDFGGLVILLAANYLFNEGMQRTRGSRVVYDPINALLEGAHTLQNEVAAGHPGRGLLELGGRELGEVLTNVPGGQMVSSNLPDSMFGIQKTDLFGQGDPNRYGPPVLFAGALQNPLWRIAPPFGGAQLQKTWKGINALMQHGYTAASGKQQFPIAWTPANFARALIFGPSATTEGQSTYKAKDELSVMLDSQTAGRADLTAQAGEEWAKLKQVRQDAGPEAAAAEWKRIQTEQPDLFAKIKTIADEESKGITSKDRLVLQLGVNNGARARYVVDQIESLQTKEEKQQLWIDYVKKKILTPEVAKQAEALLEQESKKGSSPQ